MGRRDIDLPSVANPARVPDMGWAPGPLGMGKTSRHRGAESYTGAVASEGHPPKMAEPLMDANTRG
jgi:hypothetical protein